MATRVKLEDVFSDAYTKIHTTEAIAVEKLRSVFNSVKNSIGSGDGLGLRTIAPDRTNGPKSTHMDDGFIVTFHEDGSTSAVIACDISLTQTSVRNKVKEALRNKSIQLPVQVTVHEVNSIWLVRVGNSEPINMPESGISKETLNLIHEELKKSAAREAWKLR